MLNAWWLALPAGLLVLSMAGYAIREIQQQRQALAATKAELAQARQDQAAMAAQRAQFNLWQEQLQKQQQQTRGLQTKLDQAAVELSGLQEKSTAREAELEKLVTFLKTEIEAAEAQMEALKNSPRVKTEIRRTQP